MKWNLTKVVLVIALLAIPARLRLRVEETRCTLDFPWLFPPFPASCPFRSIMLHRRLRRVGPWRGPGFE